MTDAEFVDFLKKLAPHMDAPVKFGNPWLSTGFFPFVPEDGSAKSWRPVRAPRTCGASKKIEQWGLGVDRCRSSPRRRCPRPAMIGTSSRLQVAGASTGSAHAVAGSRPAAASLLIRR